VTPVAKGGGPTVPGQWAGAFRAGEFTFNRFTSMLRPLAFVASLLLAPACLTANVAAEYLPDSLGTGLEFFPNGPGGSRNATQTFLAEQSGEVSTVEIPILTWAQSHSGLTVSFLATSALGVPLGGPGNALGTVAVSGATVPKIAPWGAVPDPWITVDFSALHLSLTSGQTYALELRSLTSFTFWLGTFGNSYLGGGAFMAFTSGSAYLAAPYDSDLAFRVNVTPSVKPPSSVVPESGATAWLVLASVAALALQRGRRERPA